MFSFSGASAQPNNNDRLYPFDKLHTYFFDKYKTEGDNISFVIRVKHFFDALLHILNHEPAPGIETCPDYAIPLIINYTSLYKSMLEVNNKLKGEQAEKQTMLAEQAEQYLFRVVENVKSAERPQADGNESLFYFAFLYRGIIPALFSKHLTPVTFHKIVKVIPSTLLFKIQNQSVNVEQLQNSALLMGLRTSKYSHAMYRYSKIVLRLLATSDDPKGYINSLRYLQAVNNYRENPIQKLAQLQIPESPIKPDTEAEIQRMILSTLLSPFGRDEDIKATLHYLTNINENSRLIADLLLTEDFLVKDSRWVKVSFNVVACALAYDHEKIIAKKFLKTFQDYYDTSPPKTCSLVRVGSLSSTGCAAFFAMLDLEAVNNVYPKERFSKIINRHNEEQKVDQAFLRVIGFIQQWLYPNEEIDLLQEVGKICELNLENSAIPAIVWGIHLYLNTQFTHYPPSDSKNKTLFETCINQLRTQFPGLGERISDDTALKENSSLVDPGVELSSHPSAVFAQDTHRSQNPDQNIIGVGVG